MLDLDGNAQRGHAIYLQRCSPCHSLGGEGSAVGPDLTTVRNDGKAKALVNICDPNREVAATTWPIWSKPNLASRWSGS